MRIILIKEELMKDHEDIFVQHLTQQGLKLTKARKLILDTVFDLHEHFDADSLYDKIRKISKDVSRATIYRTLPLLINAGLIQQAVRFEDRDHYEHTYGHPRHIHWLCRKCGAVLETDCEDLSSLIHKHGKKLKFSIEEIKLTINGICWKCSENGYQTHE